MRPACSSRQGPSRVHRQASSGPFTRPTERAGDSFFSFLSPVSAPPASFTRPFPLSRCLSVMNPPQSVGGDTAAGRASDAVCRVAARSDPRREVDNRSEARVDSKSDLRAVEAEQAVNGPASPRPGSWTSETMPFVAFASSTTNLAEWRMPWSGPDGIAGVSVDRHRPPSPGNSFQVFRCLLARCAGHSEDLAPECDRV